MTLFYGTVPDPVCVIPFFTIQEENDIKMPLMLGQVVFIRGQRQIRY